MKSIEDDVKRLADKISNNKLTQVLPNICPNQKCFYYRSCDKKNFLKCPIYSRWFDSGVKRIVAKLLIYYKQNRRELND